MKLPTDLTSRYRLSDLPAEVERTFRRLYELAGRHGDDGRLPKGSVRQLARWTRLPKSTLHRHLPILGERGLVVSTLLDRIVIPLQDTEHRFSRDGRKDDGATTTAPRRKAVREDAGGRAPRQLPIMAGVPPPGQFRPMGGTLTPQKPSAEDRSTSRGVDRQISSPEDLDPALVDQLVEALGHDVYGSLEKLARRSSAWLQLLVRPGERQQLTGLGVQSHGAVFVALQSAHDTFAPGFAGRRIENPGAWLRGTVRKILEEQSAVRAEGVS